VTPKPVDDLCVAYLYAYAAFVGLGALYDGYLTLTGQRMVTDYLREYGYLHPWFVPAASAFIACGTALFAAAAILHLWGK